MIFEPSPLTGHRLGYVQHLVEAWSAVNGAGSLVLALNCETPVQPRLLELVRRNARNGISIYGLPARAIARWRSSRNLWMRGLREGALLKATIEAIRPEAALIMFFDRLQISFALRLRFSAPVKLGAIYFRPRFHYAATFDGPSPTLRERVKVRVQKRVLAAALRRPDLAVLFCLDWYSVATVDALGGRAIAVPLADPIKQYPQNSLGDGNNSLRARLKIAPDRKVILLFGALEARKGVAQLLESLRFLSDEECGGVCLILAGTIVAAEKESIMRMVARATETRPAQIVVENRFIHDEEIAPFFDVADMVAVPYQRHVGMSAILCRAALAGKPVIGGDYGLVGELIRRGPLGAAVDTQSPERIAMAIKQALYSHLPFDREKAARFAEQNSVEAFTGTIFRYLAPVRANIMPASAQR